MRIWLERRLLARDECLAGVHGVGRPHSEVLKMCGLEDRLGSRWHEDGGLKVGLWYELCDACLERRDIRRARAERGTPDSGRRLELVPVRLLLRALGLT